MKYFLVINLFLYMFLAVQSKEKTKKQTYSSKIDSIEIFCGIKTLPNNERPLFIAILKNDSLKLHNDDLSLIAPHKIESINVIKNPKALEKYGEEGRFGVAEIILIKKYFPNGIREIFKNEKP